MRRSRWVTRSFFVVVFVLVMALSARLSLSSALAATSGTLVITMDTTLSEDHFGNIVIGEDDVRLDCDGHSVIGDGSGVGILLDNIMDATVKNCHVANFNWGYALMRSSNITLRDNTADGNSIGFLLTDSSSGNILKKNAANDNRRHGFRLFASPENTLKENTANGNGSFGFFFTSISETVMKKNTANDNGVTGIRLSLGSNGNIFKKNTADDNGSFGFDLFSTSENELINNFACGNGTLDARQRSSSGNVFKNNDFCSSAL